MTSLADLLGDDHELVLDERFDGDGLDDEVWLPYHLPQWSSRAQAAARWSITDDGLELRVDPEQPLWCPEFDGTTRVSSLQTGVRSGPVGSRDGQHRFADDLVVREAQPTRWLVTPHHGVVAVRARMTLDEHSMATLWMPGIEDEPGRVGVIDVVEVFGRDVAGGRAGVGMSVKAFTDEALVDDVATIDLALDVAESHEYAVAWSPDGVVWFVDGREVRRSTQSPDYPLQLMLGVYSFREPSPDAFVPRFVVERVRIQRRLA